RTLHVGGEAVRGIRKGDKRRAHSAEYPDSCGGVEERKLTIIIGYRVRAAGRASDRPSRSRHGPHRRAAPTDFAGLHVGDVCRMSVFTDSPETRETANDKA